jgi:hypothetical protein
MMTIDLRGGRPSFQFGMSIVATTPARFEPQRKADMHKNLPLLQDR